MAIYEIEIDDETALRWSFSLGMLRGAETPDVEMVNARLRHLVAVYGTFPEIIGEREKAAMAICRSIAAERAAQFGAREHGGSIERVAEDILNFMLRW